VETYINSSWELRICADICNASKHFKLTTPRSDQNPDLGIPNLIMQTRGKVVLRYNVETSSGSVDSFELAERCMGAWSQFLKLDVSEWFGVDFQISA
jgi:hypothetical protein